MPGLIQLSHLDKLVVMFMHCMVPMPLASAMTMIE